MTPYRSSPSSEPPVPSPRTWYALRGLRRVLVAAVRSVGQVASATWGGRSAVARFTVRAAWCAALPVALVLYGLRAAGGKYDEPRSRDCRGRVIPLDGPEQAVEDVSEDHPRMMLYILSMLAWFTAIMVGVCG